jgi:hypothetical protein
MTTEKQVTEEERREWWRRLELETPDEDDIHEFFRSGVPQRLISDSAQLARLQLGKCIFCEVGTPKYCDVCYGTMRKHHDECRLAFDRLFKEKVAATQNERMAVTEYLLDIITELKTKADVSRGYQVVGESTFRYAAQKIFQAIEGIAKEKHLEKR